MVGALSTDIAFDLDTDDGQRADAHFDFIEAITVNTPYMAAVGDRDRVIPCPTCPCPLPTHSVARLKAWSGECLALRRGGMWMRVTQNSEREVARAESESATVTYWELWQAPVADALTAGAGHKCTVFVPASVLVSVSRHTAATDYLCNHHGHVLAVADALTAGAGHNCTVFVSASAVHLQ